MNSNTRKPKLVQYRAPRITLFSRKLCRRFAHIWRDYSFVKTTFPTTLEPYPPLDDSGQDNDCKSKRTIRKQYVAPRSSLQFKVGPSFEMTTSIYPIYTKSNNEYVFPFINARLDRGFDFIDNQWIGYKRNYFTLVSAFEFEKKDLEFLNDEKFYYLDENDRKVNIEYFALNLISTCCEDDTEVNLVQHTAKRDRGPTQKPCVHIAVPGILPSHEMIKQAANIRNGNKIGKLNKVFQFINPSPDNLHSILSTYPTNEEIYKVARFERIQFSIAYQPNKVRGTTTNRHFKIVVQLLGKANDRYTLLAFTETPPLVVRGRSPSNYKTGITNERIKSDSDEGVGDSPRFDRYGRLQRFNKVSRLIETFEDCECQRNVFQLHPAPRSRSGIYNSSPQATISNHSGGGTPNSVSNENILPHFFKGSIGEEVQNWDTTEEGIKNEPSPKSDLKRNHDEMNDSNSNFYHDDDTNFSYYYTCSSSVGHYNDESIDDRDDKENLASEFTLNMTDDVYLELPLFEEPNENYALSIEPKRAHKKRNRKRKKSKKKTSHNPQSHDLVEETDLFSHSYAYIPESSPFR